jgi:hypothetical protein
MLENKKTVSSASRTKTASYASRTKGLCGQVCGLRINNKGCEVVRQELKQEECGGCASKKMTVLVGVVL